MSKKILHHPSRLFPVDATTRAVANELYQHIQNLPIISPHGHTDPRWFAENKPFANAHELLIAPDHYLLRMFYSQGISLAELGVQSHRQEPVADARSAWKCFAKHWFLFRGTPSSIWLNHVFVQVFGLDCALDESTADYYFDAIGDALKRQDFLPRNLFKRFNIELLATTEGATDSLQHHEAILQSNWQGRVITTYRPDDVINPFSPKFVENLGVFQALTGENTFTWQGYLNAHRKRRLDFAAMGATATDHGHPTAHTANLSGAASKALFEKIISGKFSQQEGQLFQAQMLTEMARMSIEDGLVMQLHPGSYRNHNPQLFNLYGADKGADIPQQINFVEELKPLLDLFGTDPRFKMIVFTLDETNYTRELAPLAGHYPCLTLGPAWWFHDSPEGMMRYREQTTETAGFYNTAGFNDDTRAFFSIPARHDVARRIDASFLARLVCEHRISETDAFELAIDLTYNLPKKAYNLDSKATS